jgi:hypothetical protein
LTEINLGWAVAWRAALAGVVLTACGLALCVVAVAALPGRDPSQRALGVLFGLALLAFGLLVLVAVRRTGLRVRADGTGMTIRHRVHGGFTVRWDELAEVALLRENRWVHQGQAWHYTLVLRPADGELPELELWRERGRYRYELGRLGFAGRRLDRALARHYPVGYRGPARYDAAHD